jgi:hypothetical protein
MDLWPSTPIKIYKGFVRNKVTLTCSLVALVQVVLRKNSVAQETTMLFLSTNTQYTGTEISVFAGK